MVFIVPGKLFFIRFYFFDIIGGQDEFSIKASKDDFAIFIIIILGDISEPICFIFFDKIMQIEQDFELWLFGDFGADFVRFHFLIIFPTRHLGQISQCFPKCFASAG